MEIKGENVGVDLQWTWSKGSLSPCPDRGQFSQLEASGPTVTPIREGTRTKVRCRSEEHIESEGSIP
jgi:hypothetical protein